MQLSERNVFWIILGVVGTLAVFCGAVWFVFGWLAPNVEIAAIVGDSFGSINAFFSALAFAGVIIALILQASEFRLAWQERNESLKSQAQIARYQELGTIVSAIQTWNGLQSGRSEKNVDNWTFDDLRYLKLRYVNAALLEAALERMLLPVSESESPIRELATIRSARLRADFAAILGNIVISQRDWLIHGWESKSAEDARAFVRSDVNSFRLNIQEELDKGELGEARKLIPEVGTCYNHVLLTCGHLESQIKSRETQTEVVGGMFEDRRVAASLSTDFVIDSIGKAAKLMLLEVERLFDPAARNLLTDEDTTLEVAE